MRYKVKFSDLALKQLKKMDINIVNYILAWIRKNLENTEDPRQHGKGLLADHSGQWIYRVGDYRLIADIDDKRIIILILEIRHRRKIYK